MRNTKHVCFGRKSLRSAHVQALEDVYGWGGKIGYPDGCISTIAKYVRIVYRCLPLRVSTIAKYVRIV